MWIQVSPFFTSPRGIQDDNHFPILYTYFTSPRPFCAFNDNLEAINYLVTPDSQLITRHGYLTYQNSSHDNEHTSRPEINN